ncbi:hypothetical protein D3C78_1629630 [compost metagenome]
MFELQVAIGRAFRHVSRQDNVGGLTMFTQFSMNVIKRWAFDFDCRNIAFGIEQPQHLTRGPKDVEVIAGIRCNSA